ncbi:golgin subfamily A member 6D-like [Palaemon carinicauda]|uniref:golgin subfamily A member 6D-like n=1 Tax=Palaemon carinicauda TaxID=392227 RepID=UPI0035B6475E
MQRPLTNKWGSFNDLTDLDSVEDQAFWYQQRRSIGSACPATANSSATCSGSSSSSSPHRSQRSVQEKIPRGSPQTPTRNSHHQQKQKAQQKQQQQPQEGAKSHKPLQRKLASHVASGSQDLQYENRHRPLSRLSQLQHEGSTSASAIGRYSLSPPRLFPPAELPPVGRLRRVFTAHTRRRKKHSNGFQLTNLMKEPLRVVHSVPLCFPEGGNSSLLLEEEEDKEEQEEEEEDEDEEQQEEEEEKDKEEQEKKKKKKKMMIKRKRRRRGRKIKMIRRRRRRRKIKRNRRRRRKRRR